MSVSAPDISTKPKRGFKLDLKTVGPLVALLLLVLLGISLNENFLSYNNLTNVLARSSFIGIIAIGATFVITSGGLDLSVGSMAAVIAGVMIMVMNWLIPSMGIGWSVVLAGMAAGILLGGVAGVFNGLMITRGRIEAFIVTLGTMGIFRSLVTFLANGGTLSLNFQVADVYPPPSHPPILPLP